MRGAIHRRIIKKRLGGPVEVGEVGARGFLHSDLPSW